MKVIGSGFGRTGTRSMKAALEILGLGPCYHMDEVMLRPHHIKIWHDVAFNKPVDWHALFKGYNSAVDFPVSIVYKELMTAFPEAKIVHTVRDPEDWYESVSETVYQTRTLWPRWLQLIVPPLGRWVEMAEELIWVRLLDNKFEDRTHTVNVFEQFTEDVRLSVPTERLLIFRVEDGWGPLCQFLDLPIPDAPFPHRFRRHVLIHRFSVARLIVRFIPYLIAIIVLALLYQILRPKFR